MRECQCGADLTRYHLQALYCSPACRHKAWQAKNKAKRNEYQQRWRKKPKLQRYAGQERDRVHYG